MTGTPFTIFLLFKYEYKSKDSSTSISQQRTSSGEEAKKASTTGLIFLQGPHQDAPNLTIIKPGFFSSNLIKWVLL
jgi:hypothetical protein